ncbi:arginine N-methyltransferase 2 [Cryptococcus neoformans]|nr:arginine N-methyltransferase 2 [Cryptococcus neoformans var. grubii]OXC65795.1 arginine N-methyltransferase 2 [Cryptococcus neoformans var. grubii MW-RSA852]UOH79406.1 arginine N-methyltransferase 2 [Cryptococcus neoformans]
MDMDSAHLDSSLLTLAFRLIKAAQAAAPSVLTGLLAEGAPAWFQDDDLGWSCLHYAAERKEPECLKVLLQGGAVWNAVDKWGRTAGEICLSLGDEEGWSIIRNEGIRSEMLHHALSGTLSPDATNNIVLRAEDKTSAGDNLVFLKSKLTWDVGKDGKERVLDADGNGVMMGWEEPLMMEHVKRLTEEHPKAKLGAEGMSVLNVGFGLGIVDRLFQGCDPKPSHHTIIEAHPQVLEYIHKKGVHLLPNVRILEGRWQDWLLDGGKVGDVLSGTPDGTGFDAIFVDTFAEGYEDLKAFFEVIPDILDADNGRFSFWNGLGATNPTIYAVSSSLAELHLEDVGLQVEWHDVLIPESMREEVWKGVRRRYWDLPGYRLPIAKMGLN